MTSVSLREHASGLAKRSGPRVGRLLSNRDLTSRTPTARSRRRPPPAHPNSNSDTSTPAHPLQNHAFHRCCFAARVRVPRADSGAPCGGPEDGLHRHPVSRASRYFVRPLRLCFVLLNIYWRRRRRDPASYRSWSKDAGFYSVAGNSCSARPVSFFPSPSSENFALLLLRAGRAPARRRAARSGTRSTSPAPSATRR